MKSILYVGAALMIGASIYGFVDYKKTSQEKEFSGMYDEEKPTAPVVVTVNEKSEPAVKKEAVTKKKTTVAKKEAAKKEEIVVAPVKSIADDERLNTSETKKIEEIPATVIPAKESITVKKAKKKKLNTKLFSRAPLREEMEVEKVLIVPGKTEVKKDDKKEL